MSDEKEVERVARLMWNARRLYWGEDANGDELPAWHRAGSISAKVFRIMARAVLADRAKQRKGKR